MPSQARSFYAVNNAKTQPLRPRPNV